VESDALTTTLAPNAPEKTHYDYDDKPLDMDMDHIIDAARYCGVSPYRAIAQEHQTRWLARKLDEQVFRMITNG